MSRYAHRIALLVLFGLWVLVAWQPLEQQFYALDQWRDRLAERPMADRAALVDYPAYLVAEQVKQVAPENSCILFLSYTGPEHVNFYKTRFDYYLYPRRVFIQANSGATAKDCEYLAVFRDASQNLKDEPFAGVWNEDELKHRLAPLRKVLTGPHLEIYRPRS